MRADAIDFTGGDNTLTLEDGSSLSGNVEIGGNGSLTFNQSSDQMLGDPVTGKASAIIGNGSVIQDGTGTLTLTGTNTYTGGTTITTGTLSVSSDDNLGGISSGLTLAGGTLEASQGFATNRAITLSGTGTIQSDDTSHPLELDGEILGAGGLVKTGAGTLTLNGANTYTGLTEVRAGTLAVGDAAHPSALVAGNAQVDPAGILRGHGTVAGSVTNDGTVWPGGSIGTLTILGNYTQAPSGTLKVDIDPVSASSLSVSGTASLAGNLQVLYAPGTYTAGKSYTILQAGSVTGQFATVQNVQAPSGITPTPFYDVSSVGLKLESTGSALGPTGSAPTVVVAPINATIFSDLGASLLRAGQHTNEVLLDRLSGVCSPSSGAGCTRPGERLWIQTEGTLTHVDGNRGAPDVHDRRYGFLVGADRTYGPWTAGIAGGYSHSDLWESGDEASAKVDTARLALYGGRTLGPVHFSGTASYAYHFTSIQRDFPGFGQTHGDGHGQEFAAGLQASVPFALSQALTVAPHLGLRYAYVDGLSEDESGLAGQSLTVQGQRMQSLQPYAGVTLDYAFTPHGTERSGHLQLRAGYAYETQDVDRDVRVVAGDGTGFVVPGTRDSRGQVTAGLGLDMPLGKAARIYARYDALLPTGNVWAQSAQVGVSYRF